MKKSMLFIPVIISLSIAGCTMNLNQPSSENVIHQASLNLDKLINANAMDVEKSLGSPYYATYYIDADKLKGEDIKNLSVKDLNEDVSALASYKDNSTNSYLHVYYEDGVIKDAFYGPYKMDNLENVLSPEMLSNADYKVTFYKNHGAINSNNFVMDTVKKDFVGKSIEDFNKAYNLKSANFIASTINESDTLYFYPLVNYDIVNKEEYNHPNYSSNENAKLGLVNPLNNNISNTSKTDNKDLLNYYKSAVAIYVKDNKIQSIQTVDNQFLYKLVEDVLAK